MNLRWSAIGALIAVILGWVVMIVDPDLFEHAMGLWLLGVVLAVLSINEQ